MNEHSHARILDVQECWREKTNQNSLGFSPREKIVTRGPSQNCHSVNKNTIRTGFHFYHHFHDWNPLRTPKISSTLLQQGLKSPSSGHHINRITPENMSLKRWTLDELVLEMLQYNNRHVLTILFGSQCDSWNLFAQPADPHPGMLSCRVDSFAWRHAALNHCARTV